MRHLLLRWLIVTISFLVAAHLVPGFHIHGAGTAFLAAVLLSLLNAFIRPILLLLTLPINILTLGLFTLVINGLVIWMVAGLLRGFRIDGFMPAFLGALVVSLTSTLINLLVHDGRRPD